MIMPYLISGVSFVSQQAVFSRAINEICVFSCGRLSTYRRVAYGMVVVMRSGGRVIMLSLVHRPWFVSWEKAAFTATDMCVRVNVRSCCGGACDASDYVVTMLFCKYRAQLVS